MRATRVARSSGSTTTGANAVFPYVKSVDVYACPSNPAGRRRDGAGAATAPGGKMASGYGMNAIATSWVPADWGWSATVLSEATITSPAELILIGEANYYDPTVDMGYGIVVAPAIRIAPTSTLETARRRTRAPP